MKFEQLYQCHCGGVMVPITISQSMKQTDDGMEQSVSFEWKCTKCGNEVRSAEQAPKEVNDL